MDTTTVMVVSGIVVVAGRWAQEKKNDVKIFVGLGASAVFLSIIDQANTKFASQVAALILVTALLIYGVDIGKKLSGGKPARTSWGAPR